MALRRSAATWAARAGAWSWSFGRAASTPRRTSCPSCVGSSTAPVGWWAPTAVCLLVRLDSAHDALQTRTELADTEATDFIVKWNPRKQDVEAWWQRAEKEKRVTSDPKRPGKRTALLDEAISCEHDGRSYTFRRLVRLVERTVDRKGQPLLLPEREIEGWWTSLDVPATQIIEL